MGNMIKKVVIISKSYGSTSRPLTSAIPKPLLPISDKTLLELQVERLAEAGFEDITFITNHKKNYIERFVGDGSEYGVRFTVRKEEEEIGSPTILATMRDEFCDAPFLEMNGDILTLADYGAIYDYGCRQDALCTAAVKRIEPAHIFGNVFLDGKDISQIKKEQDRVSYILAGICVFQPEIFDLFPLENDYYNMESFLRDIIDRKVRVANYLIEDYWLDVNRIEDLEKAQLDYMYYANGTDRRVDSRIIETNAKRPLSALAFASVFPPKTTGLPAVFPQVDVRISNLRNLLEKTSKKVPVNADATPSFSKKLAICSYAQIASSGRLGSGCAATALQAV